MLNSSFAEKNWLIKTFSEKFKKGDHNPLILQSGKDNHKFMVITPVFKNGFLVDTIETEFEYEKEPLAFPKNVNEIVPISKDLFHRGKNRLEKFFCDIGIADEWDEWEVVIQ